MRPEEKLFDAITDIDEELVESAQSYVFRKQPKTWQRVASIGGMGGSDSAANSNGAAPESSDDAGATTGDAGDQEGVQVTETAFTATVLEASDGYLLVEPVEGDPMLATADRIQVSTKGVEVPDGVTEGSKVTITFSGGVMESYPAQISDVTEIVLAGD